MTQQAIALLCALATLASVSGAARHSQLGWVCGGIIAGAALMLPGLLALPFAPLVTVEPAQIALLLSLFALARLRGSVGTRLVLFIGGMLAVIWLQSLRGVGWPLFAALPFMLCVVTIAAMLGLKQKFFPAVLQDEVAVMLLAGGLLVALVPGILNGWDSAEALQGGPAADSAAGTHVVWVVAGFVVLGATFTWVKSAWWKTNGRWHK